MKTHVLIWFGFVAAIFMACSPYPRESERMEAALKQADSVYREGENDTAMFIPGLAEASTYFAEKKQYANAALAALYNGYAEKDYDKAEAMESFKKAEHYGEIAHDSLTMARAQYQMGRLLYYEGSIMAGLVCSKKADKSFGKHYAERAVVQNGMATSYILLSEYDSALTCLNKSLSYSDLGKSDDVLIKALNNYAVLYELQGKYDKALEHLRMVKPVNDEQRVLNYLNFGVVFLALNEMDSVDYYYENLKKLLDKTKIIGETKCSVYKALSEHAERIGDFETAIDLRKKLEGVLSKLIEIRNQKNADRIQQKYDYESLQNALNRKIANRQRVIALLILVASLILTFLGVTLLRFSRIRKTEIDLKESLKHFKEQNLAMSGQSENYKNALKDAQDELSKAIAKEQRVMQKLAIYVNNPGDTSLLLALKNTAWGNEGFWAETYRLFDEQHPKLLEKLLLYYPTLSDQEQKILVLSGLNASREDTALLLQTSVHMVDKLRNNVKKKVSKLPF
ncbi:MAG: tetratricopeptide repeat protein [Bacteroidales bacterium]|nr:tetratricopeptide repeat protein [Bacteroidales bacterium]